LLGGICEITSSELIFGGTLEKNYRVAYHEKANRKWKLKFRKLLQMAVVKFKMSAF
jgi:hypothetical protein